MIRIQGVDRGTAKKVTIARMREKLIAAGVKSWDEEVDLADIATAVNEEGGILIGHDKNNCPVYTLSMSLCAQLCWWRLALSFIGADMSSAFTMFQQLCDEHNGAGMVYEVLVSYDFRVLDGLQKSVCMIATRVRHLDVKRVCSGSFRWTSKETRFFVSYIVKLTGAIRRIDGFQERFPPELWTTGGFRVRGANVVGLCGVIAELIKAENFLAHFKEDVLRRHMELILPCLRHVMNSEKDMATEMGPSLEHIAGPGQEGERRGGAGCTGQREARKAVNMENAVINVAASPPRYSEKGAEANVSDIECVRELNLENLRRGSGIGTGVNDRSVRHASQRKTFTHRPGTIDDSPADQITAIRNHSRKHKRKRDTSGSVSHLPTRKKLTEFGKLENEIEFHLESETPQAALRREKRCEVGAVHTHTMDEEILDGGEDGNTFVANLPLTPTHVPQPSSLKLSRRETEPVLLTRNVQSSSRGRTKNYHHERDSRMPFSRCKSWHAEKSTIGARNNTEIVNDAHKSASSPGKSIASPLPVTSGQTIRLGNVLTDGLISLTESDIRRAAALTFKPELRTQDVSAEILELAAEAHFALMRQMVFNRGFSIAEGALKKGGICKVDEKMDLVTEYGMERLHLHGTNTRKSWWKSVLQESQPSSGPHRAKDGRLVSKQEALGEWLKMTSPSSFTEKCDIDDYLAKYVEMCGFQTRSGILSATPRGLQLICSSKNTIPELPYSDVMEAEVENSSHSCTSSCRESGGCRCLKIFNITVMFSGSQPFALRVWPSSHVIFEISDLKRRASAMASWPSRLVLVPPYSVVLLRGDMVHAGAGGDEMLEAYDSQAPTAGMQPSSGALLYKESGNGSHVNVYGYLHFLRSEGGVHDAAQSTGYPERSHQDVNLYPFRSNNGNMRENEN